MLALRVACALWAVSTTVASGPASCPGGVPEIDEAAFLQSAARSFRPCSDSVTSKCCGDGVCDGPETSGNCPGDCGAEAPVGPSPPSPRGPPGPPGPPPDEECTAVPAEKPSEPTLCTPENQGCCDCGQVSIQTFVFWVDGVQRCFHTHNLPSAAAGPLPVVLHMDGYSGGKKGPEDGGDMGAAAAYYGFVAFTLGNSLKDGAGGFGLEFGNNGVANDDMPTPCSREDSREIAYLEKVFAFIEGHEMLNAARVFTEGFSQNSMFAVYTAVCFADRVAGTWQGGSGQSRTGFEPVSPGFQAQCSFESHNLYGESCCAEDFCAECQYWPLWPKTCGRTLVDCIAAYTDDTIACGSDWNMYEAMVGEGNDARLLSFPPPEGEVGGHRDPYNKWAWFAGCLGVADSCSPDCTAEFQSCMSLSNLEKANESFAACEAKLKSGDLDGCVVGCAPTLEMLLTSEAATVSLSYGNFGTDTGLPIPEGVVPVPDCTKDLGIIGQTGGPRPKCTLPEDFTAPVPYNPADCP